MSEPPSPSRNPITENSSSRQEFERFNCFVRDSRFVTPGVLLPVQDLSSSIMEVRGPGGYISTTQKAPALSSDSLTIPSPNDTFHKGLCQSCRRIDFRVLLRFEGGKKHHMGSVADLQRKTRCSLCRLLVKAIEATRANLADYEDLQVPFFRATNSTEPKGNKENKVLQLEVGTSIVITGAAHRLIIIRLLAKDAALIRKNSLYFARQIDPSHAPLLLLRQWIDDCNDNHSICHEIHKDLQIENLKVIDVKNYCIVTIDNTERYVALSYVYADVWRSSNEQSRSSKGNIAQQEREGGLRKRGGMPETIIDAIEMVKQLGEKYLWVDAYCIVQDDEKEKKRLINCMDRVYSRAYFTIFAAGGEDSPLAGFKPGPRPRLQHMEVVDGLRCVVALPSLEAALAETRWESRAWTYQESLLSEDA